MKNGSCDVGFEICEVSSATFFCVVNVPFRCRVLKRLENGRPSAGSRARNGVQVEPYLNRAHAPPKKVYFVNNGWLLIVLLDRYFLLLFFWCKK